MQATSHLRMCPICEAACGLVVTTDTAGNVSSIKGDPDDPFSRDFVCAKSQAILGISNDPDRLKRPLRRVGQQFVEITWEEAFDLAAERLGAIRRCSGDHSVGFYIGNPTASNPGLGLYSGALIGLIGTRQIYSASSIDAHPRLLVSALLYGDKTLMPLPDIDSCEFLLIVGANPMISNGSMLTAPGMPKRLSNIRKRGGTIVVVDPRRTETADIADEHFAIRPSTDALLLMSMVYTLFNEGLVSLGDCREMVCGVEEMRAVSLPFAPEAVASETGIAAADIRTLTRRLAGANRAAVYGRVGACCQIFGTVTSWLIDVLTILTGNLDRAGGVVFGRPIPSNALVRDPYVGDQQPYDRYRTRVRGFPEFAGQYPAFVMTEEIETPGEGQLRALVTLAGNPLLSFPNSNRLEKAIRSLDFMMSIDFYVNETTRLADLILPPAGHLEGSGFTLHFTNVMIHSYAKYWDAILPKSNNSYYDWEILLEVGSRLAGISRESFHRNHLLQLIRKVQRVTNVAAHRTPEEILPLLGGELGPDKLFDLLVRAGEFGDHLGARPDGLTIDSIRAFPHGLDLGPVGGGRLSTLIRTPDRMVHLAPPVFVEDVKRLARDRENSRVEPAPADGGRFVLSSRREARSMNSWLHNVHALAKGRDRCTLLMHPDDATRLHLASGSLVCVSNRTGTITVPMQISSQVRPGAVSLPHGFGHNRAGSRLHLAEVQPGMNINVLLDEECIDVPSGNTAFNQIYVTIRSA